MIRRRLAAISLAMLVTLTACGGNPDAPFGRAPVGLPAEVGFNDAIYDHAFEVAAVPLGVEKHGTVPGHGVEYAPAAGPQHPREVWVVKGDQVWKYTYDFTINLH